MTTNVCDVIAGDPAPALVGSAWYTFQRYADRAYNTATYQIEGLNDFTVEFTNWDASWQGGDGTLTGFTRPERPELPTISVIDLSGTVPNAPTLNIPSLTLDAVPPEPASLLNPPDLNLTVNPPDPIDASRPGDAPTLEIPDAPTEPTLATITVPVLVAPEVPLAPSITIEEFDEDAPEFTATVPDAGIDFTESPYVSAFLDALKTHLERLAEGRALPPEVENALFERSAEREDRTALQARQEVREEFSKRGFSPEPNGLLANRLMQVTQTAQSNKRDLNREITLENEKIAIENVRFAVTQGIQLEGMLLDAHLKVEQRRFELAAKIKDLALAVFQAHVSQFNAVVAAYNARIDAYRAFIEGQKSQVEVYKAQVEAAKLEGEINLQQVQIYEAQIRAENSRVEIYRAQIEGFRARIEAERTKIEGHRSEVEAYRAFVEAYKAEWDAERTRIDAEARRGDLYNSLVNAYSARVDVWKTKGDARIAAHGTHLAQAEALLKQHDAQVRTVEARLDAQKAVVQAQGVQTDAIARMYQADAAVETAAVEADTRAFNALVARENARLEIALKDAGLQIEQVRTIKGLLLQAMQSAASASTQLAASSMSAVNFSAGVSSGHSRSSNCNTSFNYSGEILDAL